MITQCDASCTPATAAIAACGDTADACLCAAPTVAAVVGCEQCLFAALIAAHAVAPDPRVGQSSALAGASLFSPPPSFSYPEYEMEMVLTGVIEQRTARRASRRPRT